MSIPALLNVNQLAARKGAHELEFAVKKVHSLMHLREVLRIS
jgi:hypothetical protein